MPLSRTLRVLLAAVLTLLPLRGLAQASALARSGGPRNIALFVELNDEPVASIFGNDTRPARLAASAVSARALALRIRSRQAAVETTIGQLGGKVTGQFSRVANALRVQVPEDQIAAIAALPGVRRVQRVRLYSRQRTSAVPFVGGPTAWSTPFPGTDGRGLRIGIVDSGIDYTHADFGGSGDVADFRRNDPTRIEPGSFPTAKVVGGFDFAGDRYNPGDGANDTPIPDEDPLDCAANGHGTHVAGIAAGFGVLTNGVTYRGEYTNEMDFGRFNIGPGTAPRASLYALKVFGCTGTTALVTDALEWAADPNGDFDFSDRLDVVNLSLGGSFGVLAPDDTEIAAVTRLTALGCVVVAAAGNDENIFYAVGAPSVAPAAISVANSITRGLGSALTVTGPVDLAGKIFMVEGAITPALTNTGPVTGRLVAVDPILGCDAPRNAAELAGNIAVIDRGTCFFSEKILNAQRANAIAVIVVNNSDAAPIPMGGEGAGIQIPGVMISKADGDRLKARLASGITVRLDGETTIDRAEFIDTLDDSSSRGPGSPDNALKPDISAPGANVVSANAGSGNEGASQGGTSMSAPAVAGAAALLRQLHPDWSVESIKAALMNTARPLVSPEGVPYPESRMGAGRLQMAQAARIAFTASADSTDAAVGVSFGTVFVNSPFTATRRVRLVNHSDRANAFRVVFSNSVAQAGVRFSPETEFVAVPARSTITTSVRLAVDPQTLALEPDATTPLTVGGGTVLPRHFLHEASGQLWFIADNAQLHVPCHAVLRAASDLRSSSSRIVLPSRDSTKVLPEVTLGFEGSRGPIRSFPLVSVFQLGDTSPDRRLADPARAAADLLAVGAATDVASVPTFDNAQVYFGLAVSGSWTTPQPELNEYNVLIDVNSDGFEDFVVYNHNASSTNNAGSPDTLMSVVLELDRNLGVVTTNAVAFLNHYAADELDTAVFNNSVLVLPVPVAAIGLSDRSTKFRYKVETFASPEPVDRTGWIPFDAAHPIVDTAFASPDGTPFHDDGDPVVVRLDRERARDAGQRLPSVLLLHHFNPPDRRAEVVALDLAREDTDNDSLPDWWEQRHFSGLTPATTTSDFDGDGSPETHELNSGTDPKDPGSVFRMRSATRVSARNITVRWSGIAGQTYALERSTNLLAGFPLVIRDNIRSTPPLNSITDTNAAGVGPFFYRVRLRP